MSDTQSTFTLTQDVEIMRAQKTNAMLVDTQEWCFLKRSVEGISDSNSLFHTLGSSFIGAGISTFITFFFTTFTNEQETQKVVMLAASVVCILCGALSCYFAHKEKDVTKKSSDQVLFQMSVIENRFKSKS